MHTLAKRGVSLISERIDVLCVGLATFDIILEVDHHPGEDEKSFASTLLSCGGGPASNAAVAVARLGGKGAFMGYLGKDVQGEQHLQELLEENVHTEGIVRGESPTPLSVILVKPQGHRTVVSYKGASPSLPWRPERMPATLPGCVLFDGHQPGLSVPLARLCVEKGVPTVLDGGSVHEGTLSLLPLVDHAVVSTSFARRFSGEHDLEKAMARLKDQAPCVVITMGEKGLLWQKGGSSGHVKAFSIDAVDTTGAGDTFHGAYALCVSRGEDLAATLKKSSAAAALCCRKVGARRGIPRKRELNDFLQIYGQG